MCNMAVMLHIFCTILQFQEMKYCLILRTLWKELQKRKYWDLSQSWMLTGNTWYSIVLHVLAMIILWASMHFIVCVVCGDFNRNLTDIQWYNLASCCIIVCDEAEDRPRPTSFVKALQRRSVCWPRTWSKPNFATYFNLLLQRFNDHWPSLV